MDNLELNAKAIELRKHFGEDENSSIDIFALANQVPDLSLLLYPMGEHISGVCIKNTGSNLIAINSLMTYGRQRFSLGHEFYHLFFDESNGVTISAKTFDTDNENEKTADRFASYFLVPYNALRSAVMKIGNAELTLRDVVSLEQMFGISHKAMLWRLVNDGYLKEAQAEEMKGSVLAFAKLYGYGDKLYLPSDETTQRRTYGNYVLQAEELKNSDKISVGKYEELLIDAFRYDIVYGDDEIGGEIDD